MANINVYGTFNSLAEDQTVAKARQIYDDEERNNQAYINAANRASWVELIENQLPQIVNRILSVYRDWMPSTSDGVSFPVNGVTVNYVASVSGNSLVFEANSEYRVRYTTTKIPKGSIVYVNLYYTTSASSWTGRARFAITTTDPVVWVANNGDIVGLPNTLIYNNNNSKGGIRNYEYYATEDCWLILDWQNAYGATYSFSPVIPSSTLKLIASDWYGSGIANSSAMASIAGLGYNLYDYISGAINMAGFEYGSRYRLENPKKSGNGGSMFKDNTSFVYFPKLDMLGVTTQTYSMFQNCTNLVVVPHLTFNITGSAQNMFNGCSNLVVVDKLTGLKVNAGLYMFAGCTSLQRIEEVDISAMVMTTHKATTNMFRSNSGTGTAVLSNLRYILLKGIGTLSSVTAYWFANPRNWGVNTTAISDAKQSLWDSLYTYSYDRATAGYSNCTIHVYSNTLNALTTEEKQQITAKGYILTTS